MLLAVDLGNTNTVLGLYRLDEAAAQNTGGTNGGRPDRWMSTASSS